MNARAVVFVGPRQVELVDRELPALEPGEVLVRTLWSGISSGTELLAYRGELDPGMPLDETIGALGGTFRFPFSYGYSCVGRVERSRADLAEGGLVFAFHPHCDRFNAPAHAVVPVEGVEPRLATLFPLVETAFQITLDAGAVQEEPVPVVGLGPVGLLTALLLRRGGATVVASDPRPWRRRVAAGLGVEAVEPGSLSERTSALTESGVPIAVEVSGDPDALVSLLPLLSHEGTALVASWYGDKQVVLPLGREFHRRRLSIRSTQVSTIPAAQSHRWTVPRRRRAVRSLLDELPLAALATHDFPFTAAGEAFGAVDRGEEGLIHAALRYD